MVRVLVLWVVEEIELVEQAEQAVVVKRILGLAVADQ